MTNNCRYIAGHPRENYKPTKKELGVQAVKEDFNHFLYKYLANPKSYRFERDYLCRVNTVLFELVRPRQRPMSERVLKKHIKSLKKYYQDYCEE